MAAHIARFAAKAAQASARPALRTFSSAAPMVSDITVKVNFVEEEV